MLNDYDALVDWIVGEIGPKTVLAVGIGQAPLISALGARECEVFAIEAAIEPMEKRYDVIVCLGGLDGLTEDGQRMAVQNICAATEDVLFGANYARSRSYWVELFAEEGFFLDTDLALRFVVTSSMRFRKARTRGDLEEPLRCELKRLLEVADSLYRATDEKDKLIRALRLELTAQKATLGWRLLERIRKIRERALRYALLGRAYLILHRVAEVLLEEGPKEVLVKAGHKIGLAVRGRSFLVQPRGHIPGDLNSQYQLWLKRHSLGARDLRAMQAAIEKFAEKPVISVLSVVGGEKDALQKMIDTMRAQIYPRWELCLATVSSVDTGTKRLLDDLMVAESRIRMSASDGSGPALGTALRQATGDFVGLLDAHDELAPEALFEVVKRLNEDPCLDILYSDEDAVTPEGGRVSPFFKPDWSPDLLLSTNYVARFSILRRRLVEEIGGFRSGLDGGHEYDLILRATERTRRIAHIPKILYHRRQGISSTSDLATNSTAIEAERHAIEDALRRRGLHGQVELNPSGYSSIRCYSVRYRVNATPLVSIIIPTRDKWHLLEQCMQTIQEKTTYQQYEIIIIDNESTEPETRRYLDSIAGKCRVFSYEGGFNFAKINNFGATQAHGEYLLFLNNDVEVLRPDWLTAMLEHAQRPEVGAVGAKLLYPDGRIQHAGVVVGIGGGTGHAFRLWPGDDVGEPRLAHIIRNCSAVTAACMMVPRRVFDEVGGFDERFRVAFSDVDFCLRIRERGYLIVYTPFALLYHYEGASRGRAYPSKDDRLFRAVWADLIGRGDPYYNPNLTDTRDDWSLRL